MQNLKKKLTYGLKTDKTNLANFYQSSRKPQNWNFDEIFLSKVKNVMSLKITEDLCVMPIKNDEKLEEEFTCRFKIDERNLTNFDRSTQKSQKFAL